MKNHFYVLAIQLAIYFKELRNTDIQQSACHRLQDQRVKNIFKKF